MIFHNSISDFPIGFYNFSPGFKDNHVHIKSEIYCLHKTILIKSTWIWLFILWAFMFLSELLALVWEDDLSLEMSSFLVLLASLGEDMQ